jgi:uncharacterized membrane protein YdjX (TVP38/TMEM64 family)
MQSGNRVKPHLVAQIIMLVAFLGLVTYVSFKFGPAITRLMSHPERFKEFVDENGSASALLYILIQIAHVIIVLIPGEIVQIAGGYAFGTLLGTLYSLIGIVIGMVIVFFATRLVGYSLVRAFVPPNRLKKFDFLINSQKSEIALFILFLIPGLPKDTLVYISGLTPVKPWRFLLISAIARFPGLWGSAYIGANLQEKDYLPVWIMSGLALVLFVGGILVKDRIIRLLHRHGRSGKDAPPGSHPMI